MSDSENKRKNYGISNDNRNAKCVWDKRKIILHLLLLLFYTMAKACVILANVWQSDGEVEVEKNGKLNAGE